MAVDLVEGSIAISARARCCTPTPGVGRDLTDRVEREWRVAVASVAGTAPLANGVLCQDWAEVRFAEGAPTWSHVFWPQHYEYVNETNFITVENALSALDFDVRFDRVEEVVLFTDGIEHLVMVASERSVHQPFVEGIVGPVRSSSVCGIDQTVGETLSTTA